MLAKCINAKGKGALLIYNRLYDIEQHSLFKDMVIVDNGRQYRKERFKLIEKDLTEEHERFTILEGKQFVFEHNID